METFAIKNLTFSYPNSDKFVLNNISLSIKRGEFITLCGKSGCGKSTFLKHLKTDLSPHGDLGGEILFQGEPLKDIDHRTQAAKIGYVLQSPDNQIVTDNVWHELAFGLESLGVKQEEIRLKVAEIASFFDINEWFYKKTAQLSGGQKQLLNLASVMAMQPDVLILDEPTSQLDPIAAAEFLGAIGKINRELGITIILSEHRLEEVIPFSDRILVMDAGEIIASGNAYELGKSLKERNHQMFYAMPAPMRVYAGIENNLQCPVTVREGRYFLSELCKIKQVVKPVDEPKSNRNTAKPAIELQDIWFKYEKEGPDIVKGLSFKAYSGEIYSILGGNGAGKTTALSILSGLRRSYRGKALVHGAPVEAISDKDKFNGILGVLPQNPQALFVHKTVELDLLEILKDKKYDKNTRQKKLDYITKLCNLEGLLQSHPYDLSGGEQQRAGLAKVLLLEPAILLLDEPTKGLDAHFKLKLAEILYNLKKSGVAIIMVSHDIEFCASFSDRCAMFFDGTIVSEGTPRSFFTGNSFYTTTANRMAREVLPMAVTVNDIINAFGGKEEGIEFKEWVDVSETRHHNLSTAINNRDNKIQVPKEERKLSKRTLCAAFMILLFIPITIWFGIYYLDDRKYYFISMLVIIETMLPFFMVFEGRKPQARELVVISVLCAIGVCGRMAFFWIPQFKPVAAVVILSGVAFGGETGFLVGAATGFISNYFFGQGPWTPWQMFAFGIIGFLAGVLFKKGVLRRKTISLSIFGGVAVFLIYGVIMNTSSVMMTQAKLSLEVVILSWIRGIPFDLIHGVSTVIFLLIISRPMLEKLDRIKEKYGLID